jgi:hypothetical protein
LASKDQSTTNRFVFILCFTYLGAVGPSTIRPSFIEPLKFNAGSAPVQTELGGSRATSDSNEIRALDDPLKFGSLVTLVVGK